MNSFHKILLLSSCIALTSEAFAQDAKSYGLSAEVPVFERIDQNGVDLVTGSFRMMSPTLETGPDDAKTIIGLQWTGKAWTYIDVPSIWFNDKKNYIVNYAGTSQEFKGYSDNFAEKKPITGARLTCTGSVGAGFLLTSSCTYTHRTGDVIFFTGIPNPFTQSPTDYGTSVMAWGNLGMAAVRIYSVDNRDRRWGFPQVIPGGNFSPYIRSLSDGDYYKINKALNLGVGFNNYGAGSFTINTPNHNTDQSKHYLRPKNTTQTFTDGVGTQWKYTVNDNRLMTKVDRPGNAADVTITYSNGRVSTVTNPNGTWTYSYSTVFLTNRRTTTVTDPLNQQTKVTYNTDKSYVLEHSDPMSRLTKYEYDSGDRLSKVTFPELNYVTYVYDVRGNIVSSTRYPKPGSGLSPITETAEYSATCGSPVTCNLPISVTDSLLRKTEFEYPAPVQRVTAESDGLSTINVTHDYGTTKPKTVTSPAPFAGAARPQVRNEYDSGTLIRSSYCRTQSSCIGTSDEVVTTYDYGVGRVDVTNPLAFQGGRLMFGMSVTSEGQTLTTCYAYDTLGRRVSETPARADITLCPAVIAPTAASHAPAVAQPSSAPVFPTP